MTDQIDKRPKDMTPEELSALPDAYHLENEFVTDPQTGHTTVIRKQQKVHIRGMNGDDIAFFTDSSGTWQPEYHGPEIGWAKRQVFL